MGNLFGRRKLYTATEYISKENVVEELNRVLPTHFRNVTDEKYLSEYRKGKQPINDRVKNVRPEINHKIVQNTADYIVEYKNGYFLSKPTFYISRKKDESMADALAELNDYLYLSGKADADNAIVDDFHTMGLGVLYVEATGDAERPVSTCAVDPRQAFVVYSCRPGNEPVMGVSVVTIEENDNGTKVIFDVWTKDRIFHIDGGSTSELPPDGEKYSNYVSASSVISEEVNAIGEIPIIEYEYNKNRMGAFENVIDLCDALNDVTSDRANGVEQFIQSLMVLTNCTLGDDEYGNPITAQAIRESGLIELKSVSSEGGAKVDILSEQLDQTQTQVYVDDLVYNICVIAGLPITSKSSTSNGSNNGAAEIHGGLRSVETRARNTEDLFKKSNRRFDKIFLKILKFTTNLDIKYSDIDIQFTRNDNENILTKTEAALNLKTFGFSPEICAEKSGISNDPAGDVARSLEYIKKAFATEEPTEVVKGEENNDRQRDSDNDKESELPNDGGNNRNG